MPDEYVNLTDEKAAEFHTFWLPSTYLINEEWSSDNSTSGLPYDWMGTLVRQAPLRSRLDIGPGALVIESPTPMPNWWHRLWMRLLLGWQWERIEEAQ